MTAYKYRKLIVNLRPAIEEFAAVTGHPQWFAQNIILWRASRKLPVTIGRVLDA